MISTINTGHELYVFMNGVLIYKKWLSRGTSRTFHEGEGLTQFCKDRK